MVGIAFFLAAYLGLEFPLIISLVLAIGMFIGTGYVTKPRKKIGTMDLSSFGNADDLTAILEDIKSDNKKLKKAGNSIKNQIIKADIARLSDACDKIINWLADHPEQIGDAKKFGKYYLDAAVSLAEKYHRFESTNPDLNSVRNAMDKTEQGLGLLQKAFDKELEQLMEGEMIDVSADIDVLKNMINTDFGESDFKGAGIE
ncbi:MAG: 5-bromo-4-chloroindolyl phosphate hydrolysis family protein [Catonella sp.]|nr:5-bromo-4-chloroindolyl phosphate hydrolysis family protein [Catonella sp.]MDY6357038.1 5-bromo-4-chloroindolyl phosphate hydrolysis family protein [Catonella sp.]